MSAPTHNNDFKIVLPGNPIRINTTVLKRSNSFRGQIQSSSVENSEGSMDMLSVTYRHLRRESSLSEVVDILDAVEIANHSRVNKSLPEEQHQDDEYDTYFSESEFMSPNTTNTPAVNLEHFRDYSPVTSGEPGLTPPSFTFSSKVENDLGNVVVSKPPLKRSRSESLKSAIQKIKKAIVGKRGKSVASEMAV
ncbi:hypothetical protein AKO1_009244 [Acrasis kona]|uniref:Uncharacterized protein n=1 Tax=Acrasis kona TaxID=1008807 RepID=A0AAW2ZLG2_9EUKA